MENSVNNTLDGYFAIILNKESQALLIKEFPPLHQKIFAHHITIAYKPDLKTYAKLKDKIGTEFTIKVYGYAEDENGQAVLVKVDSLNERPLYHITISTNNSAPVYSNTLVSKGHKTVDSTLMLHGVFSFIQY